MIDEELIAEEIYQLGQRLLDPDVRSSPAELAILLANGIPSGYLYHRMIKVRTSPDEESVVKIQSLQIGL